MSKRARLLLLVTSCCVVLLGGAALRWNVVRLYLANHAGRPISDVRLAGRCFERLVPRLDADESRTYWVRPCGDSSVALTFRSGAEQVARTDLGYFESGGGYSIELVVGPDLGVAVEEFLWPQVFGNDAQPSVAAAEARSAIPDNTARIVGLVTWSEDGTPAAGVVVYARRFDSSDMPDFTTTDQSGRYEIKGLMHGDYQMEAYYDPLPTMPVGVDARTVMSLHGSLYRKDPDVVLLRGDVVHYDVRVRKR